jgi:hypothetical protein
MGGGGGEVEAVEGVESAAAAVSSSSSLLVPCAFAGGLRGPCFLRPEACEVARFVLEPVSTALSREAAWESLAEARGGGGMELDDEELDAAADAVAVGGNLSRAACGCRLLAPRHATGSLWAAPTFGAKPGDIACKSGEADALCFFSLFNWLA